MLGKAIVGGLVAATVVAFAVVAQAVTIDLVPVGNPGNAPDTRYNGVSVGAVNYTYNIGKYDVTAGQYCEFLNAVAATDTYTLYSGFLISDSHSCKIERSGDYGSCTYYVAPDYANRPVNFVTWGNAARFCNWLQNGQPTGPQNLSTTEDGAYYLNGARTSAALMAATRKADATWVIPTEDEWYKAAYYDPNKLGGAGYWDYPTKSNLLPVNVLSSTGTNNANFWDSYYGTYTIGKPYYRTEVGAFAASPSPYGTFDQGGNVWQWNETNVAGYRGIRGGSFWDNQNNLLASCRSSSDPPGQSYTLGFRVAFVPEPDSITLLVAAAVSLLAYAWRRRGQAT